MGLAKGVGSEESSVMGSATHMGYESGLQSWVLGLAVCLVTVWRFASATLVKMVSWAAFVETVFVVMALIATCAVLV